MLSALLWVLCCPPAQCQTPTPSPVLSGEQCEPGFDVAVPAALLRAHRSSGLSLVVNYLDADNLVRLDLKPSAVSVTLRREGKETLLARGKIAGLPQTADLVVKRRPGEVAVACGVMTAARAKADLPDGGRWGALGLAEADLGQVTYQPIAEVAFTDDFMRGPDEASPWTDVQGDWRLATLRSSEYSANAFTLTGAQSGHDPALTLAGDWFWEDCTAEVSVRPAEAAEGFGVALYAQPGLGYHLLRYLAAGKLQLVCVRGTREEVLAETAVSIRPNEWHRLAVSAVGEGLAGAVDGQELLTATDPTLAHGQIGLWVAGREAVDFDDVEAYSGPRRARRPTVLAYAAEAAEPAAARFIADHYMEGWADERDQWRPASGPSLWHTGCFWGDVSLTWRAATLTSATTLHLCVPPNGPAATPPRDTVPGYHLTLAPIAGQVALTLTKGGVVRGEATVSLPQNGAEVALRRTGGRIEGLLNGQPAVAFDDDQPLPGGKLGLTAPGASQQAPRLAITALNVLDSTFRTAPTEWRVAGGDWRVQSRWACTPRWSWFSGRSPDLAAIWTRNAFAGDVIVEFFAGFQMDSPWAPFYQHPSNINVTLCGDGATPGSGYSFLLAGWENRATAILRRGEVVAQTTQFLLPDILDSLGGNLLGGNAAIELHKQWQHLRVERIGGTLRFSVDGRLALSYDDPDRLPGGSVGIWTLDNGLTVARARVYYQSAEPARLPAVPVADAPPLPALPLNCAQPDHLADGFEHGCRGWTPVHPGDCLVSLAKRDGAPSDRCLLVANPRPGGSFALSAPVRGVDLQRHPVLAFDYAVPENVRVDVFAIVAGHSYRLRLTGPEVSRTGVEELGAVAGVRCDGSWRHAEVDLLGQLRPYFRPDEPIILEALQFASYAPAEYLVAGVGGNPMGASYRLDNFFLGAPTAESVRIDVVRGAHTSASGLALGAGPLAQARRSGVVPVTAELGGRTGVDLVAFDCDAPVVEPLAPGPGSEWLGRRLAVRVADSGPAGIDEHTLSIQVNGRSFVWPDAALARKPLSGELSLDLRAAGFRLTPGTAVPVRIGPVRDRAGNAAAPLEFAFTPSLEADRDAPDAPVLTHVAPPLCSCDFEQGAGCLRPWGVDSGADLRRARGPAATNPDGGEWCLEIANTKIGGLFGIEVACVPFEASRYPLLTFDYCVPDTLRVDLLVDVAGSRRTIKFTDNDATWPAVGTVPATADGKWHHAAVDLYGLLHRAFPGAKALPVTRVAFASSGWPGNRRDTTYWLDNLEILPTVDVTAQEIPALTARDESGISALAWTVDRSPSTAAPHAASSDTLASRLAACLGELAWLHAAACDGAGNWSLDVHLPLRPVQRTDVNPPSACDPTPAPGARACTNAVAVTLADDASGLSPADVRLTVGDRTYSIADGALALDPVSGRLTWTTPPGVSLGADGSEVRCTLEARDLAGNALAQPFTWTWRMDYSQDKAPPPAPVVSYVPSLPGAGNGFEADTGMWGNFLSCQVLRREEGGATGPGCLELRDLREPGGACYALVQDLAPDWQSHPLLRFRYRSEGAPNASLVLRGTTFDGSNDLWTALAALPPAGPTWQTAVVDLAAALKAANPHLTMHRLFLEVGLPSLSGAVLIDDFALYSRTSTGARFRWAEPPDPSGVRGYSWLLDARDDSLPPETLTGRDRQAEFIGLSPGHHCFHLRAWDGAGNWGPATHLPFDVLPPSP